MLKSNELCICLNEHSISPNKANMKPLEKNIKIDETLKPQFKSNHFHFNLPYSLNKENIESYVLQLKENLFRTNINYNDQNLLFIYDDGHFHPTDKKEFKDEMEIFGRILHLCYYYKINLNVRLSPLIYCILANKQPKNQKELFKFLKSYSPLEASNIESNLNSSNSRKNEKAKIELSYLKEQLYGKKFRKINIEHINNGFKQSILKHQNELIKTNSCKDFEIFFLNNI